MPPLVRCHSEGLFLARSLPAAGRVSRACFYRCLYVVILRAALSFLQPEACLPQAGISQWSLLCSAELGAPAALAAQVKKGAKFCGLFFVAQVPPALSAVEGFVPILRELT
jgi:hypothetical protein